jgi:transcriptional regulator GlxA family with amidase domain
MPLADVAAPVARTLSEALEPDEGASRAARLIAALATRVSRARTPSAAAIALSSRALEGEANGGVRALARDSGLGVRRVQAIFSEEVGAGPKLLMRLGRFQRALALARDARLSWGAIAARAGYFDHAHLIRDARQFAGCTPSELFPGRPSLTEVFLG